MKVVSGKPVSPKVVSSTRKSRICSNSSAPLRKSSRLNAALGIPAANKPAEKISIDGNSRSEKYHSRICSNYSAPLRKSSRLNATLGIPAANEPAEKTSIDGNSRSEKHHSTESPDKECLSGDGTSKVSVSLLKEPPVESKGNFKSRKCAESTAPLRKSSRLNAALRIHTVKEPVQKTSVDDNTRSEKSRSIESKGNFRSRKCAKSNAPLRKSSRLNAALRIHTVKEPVQKTSVDGNTRSEKSRSIESPDKVYLSVNGTKVGLSLFKESPVESNGDFSWSVNTWSIEMVTGKSVRTGDTTVGINRERTEATRCLNLVNKWTEEQELALQKAYFAAKPTPHFWKKVAKLVPGKSAQDCFDKIHSSQLTPPQPPLRTRAKKTDTSLLSASKVLKPSKQVRKSSYRKQKSLVYQKNIQKLLQRSHGGVTQDLFSVLEPANNPSGDMTFSTPSCVPAKRWDEMFRSPFWSPPILKQVTNQAMHDKYIAQLNTREAKRKAAALRAGKSLARDDCQASCVQKVDVVRAAKFALVSDVQDAISQFRHKQQAIVNYSSELDDGGDINDDECDV